MVIIGDEILSGFIGEVISRCVDFSWTKIKEAVKNRKNKHQNIESQIYNVVVNVLNQITYNKFENDQDKIYQATEKLLIGYKDSRCDSIEVVKSGLQILGESVNDDKYIQFKTLLYQELSKADYDELYRQIRLFQQDEENSKASRIEYSINEIKQVVLNDKQVCEEHILTIHNMKFQNNRKQDYIKNWNSRLFLHMDNDENPLILADAFIMPDYEIHKSIKRIGFCDNDTLDQIMEKFIVYDRTSTLLVIGVPGIGKSSIVSWIANEYKDDDRIIVLRFRDWKRIILEKTLLSAIYNKLECEEEDLENKILILDGFDEMKALNIREKLLNDFFMDIRDFENFKCIITSRSGYINSLLFHNVIRLKQFDIEKVNNFVKIITGNIIEKSERIEPNLEVLGIPVILYMAVMSNIDISKNPTKPELYNRIFAKKGGIFDKFFDGEVAYSKGKQILREPNNIKSYLDFLQRIAFKMFEKDDLSLLEGEYQIPELECQGNFISILEFPIKYLFENTTFNIEFIHKSIYEYFVAEYIFKTLFDVIDKSEEKIACVLGKLFTKRLLSPEILEFLSYKISNTKLGDKYDVVKNAFQLMLQDGMTYYTSKYYKNVIECELYVFANMLEIIHLWSNDVFEFSQSLTDYIEYNKKLHLNLAYVNLKNQKLENVILNKSILDKSNLANCDLKEIKLCGSSLVGADLKMAKLNNSKLNNANLKYADLCGACLCNVDLENANLSNADLTYTNLKGANLKNVNLVDANLSAAVLLGANLVGVKLSNTELSGAELEESQIIFLEKQYDMQGVKVYLDENKEKVSYKEYCNRRK